MNDTNYGYLFSVRPTLAGPLLDRFVDVTTILTTKTVRRYVKSVQTYKAMGMNKESIDEYEAPVHEAITVFFRAKMNVDNDAARAFLVKTEDPLDPNDLQAVLTAKSRDGSLAAFLDEARVL